MCILRGNSTNVSKIDGEYFQHQTLAGWTEKATLVAFNYHALLLYISVLLDDHSTGMKAIENCAKTVQGVKGNSCCRTNEVGLLVTAYALYWEAIIRLRQYESWKDSDSERFEYILSFLRPRVQYAPSTFQHKVLFLEGPSP